MLKRNATILVVAVAGIAAAGVFMRTQARGSEPNGRPGSTVEVKKEDFVRSVRLSGTVEAVQATTISAPRLAGQNNNSLVIMRLIHAGTTVRPGDMLVEFDRQDQLRNALDRKADLVDLEQQIRKRQAQEVADRAGDDSTMMQAQSAQSKAKLELVKNDMLPKIQAEKNTLDFEAI